MLHYNFLFLYVVIISCQVYTCNSAIHGKKTTFAYIMKLKKKYIVSIIKL